MTAGCLTLLAVGAIGVFAQSPSQQIQAQQQREVQERGDEQRRAIAREQREQVDREHAEERLLQRRAEQQQVPVQQPEMLRTKPEIGQTQVPLAAPPVLPKQPRYDFSPGLMARSLGVGLLAGAVALLLGKAIQRRFSHG